MPDVINGEAYAGSGLLWQTDFDSQTIRLIDTSDCGVVQTCSVPSGAPSENAFDGQYVYHYNFGTGLLYKIDPSDCTIFAQCNPPGDDLAEGLTFDGEFLWKGDSTTLFKISGPPGCSVISSCPNPSGDSADGLGVCGNFLIMLGYSGTLYQIDRDTCEVVSSCALNAGADGNGLTTDGVSSPFVDQPGFIDVVDVNCSVPIGPKLPDGASCTSPDDCLSSYCVDGVCCDTACGGAGQACDVAGLEGTCTQTRALAPAASRTGLLVTVLILAAVGVFTVVRRGRA